MDLQKIKEEIEKIEEKVKELKLEEILNKLKEVNKIVTDAYDVLYGKVDEFIEKYCNITLILGTISSKIRLFCFDRTKGEVIVSENLTPEIVKEELKKFITSEKFTKILMKKLLKVLNELNIEIIDKIEKLLNELYYLKEEVIKLEKEK